MLKSENNTRKGRLSKNLDRHTELLGGSVLEPDRIKEPLTMDANPAVVNDPKWRAVKKELDGIVHHIKTDIGADGSAKYLLTVLPPLLKKLETTYISLVTIEAKIKCGLEDEV